MTHLRSSSFKRSNVGEQLKVLLGASKSANNTSLLILKSELTE